MEFVVKDSVFGTISSMRLSFETITYFIENHIDEHPNRDLLLSELSNLFVLVALKSSDGLTKDGEKTWKDIMTHEQYDNLQKNNRFILGYLLVYHHPKQEIYQHNCGYGEVHLILLMDTIIRHLNIGKEMICRYETYNEETYPLLIPQEIIFSATGYWKKYFERCHSIYTIEDLDEFIKEYYIDRNNIKWDHLYQKLVDQ